MEIYCKLLNFVAKNKRKFYAAPDLQLLKFLLFIMTCEIEVTLITCFLILEK